jgi:hypothetical protein
VVSAGLGAGQLDHFYLVSTSKFLHLLTAPFAILLVSKQNISCRLKQIQSHSRRFFMKAPHVCCVEEPHQFDAALDTDPFPGRQNNASLALTPLTWTKK